MEGTSGGISGRMGLESWGEKLMEVFLAKSADGAQDVNKVLMCQGYRSLLRGTGASILETHILNKIYSCSTLRFDFLENRSHVSTLKQFF